MDYGIENTASGLSALNQQYQAISNNLANANTAGYKRELALFHQVLASQMAGQEGSYSQVPYAPVAAETPVSTGGEPAAPPPVGNQVYIDFSQGEVSQTGRKLDVALAGKGFLAIEIPDGPPRYTRNGQLQISPDGRLVNNHAQNVAGEGGPLTIPNNISSENIQISADGTIRSGDQLLGKLRIVEFEDVSKLVPVGNGLFAAAQDQTPAAATKTTVLQGYYESSNVRMVDELVSLIMTTRLYEANAKSISQMDERLKNLLSVSL